MSRPTSEDQEAQKDPRPRPPSSWQPIVLVAAVATAGGLGTLAVGAAEGMKPHDLAHLSLLLLPASLATIACTVVARPLLSRSSIRSRLAVVSTLAVLVSLANLAVLARLMFVERHDATQIAVLLVYSAGTGLGAAVVLSRSHTAAMRRLSETARSLGAGDLTVRVGPLGGGRELDGLGRTMDEMAGRLQEAIGRERAAETMRRDLVTAVSHDLRTPLAGLRAMVEAIDDGVVADLPSLRRYAGQMKRSVNSLVVLVDDLFELAQLDAGAIEWETERARLIDVVRSAVAACESTALQKGLRVSAELNGAEQAECSPRLVRVLQNLLQNAIRHTPADGSVRIEAHRMPSGLEVAVQDTGEGIAAESLTRVFEPFWRGDQARSGEGSGLGLAVAKRIVESLGGTIEVESEPHGGSRFAVVVPEPA
jgi:signal transduction histidine kinase